MFKHKTMQADQTISNCRAPWQHDPHAQKCRHNKKLNILKK